MNKINAVIALVVAGSCIEAVASSNELQSQLMNIASEEAVIATIGTNKLMMLYGTANPLPIIARWNLIERKSNLNKEQIDQINNLEQQKQIILQQAKQ